MSRICYERQREAELPQLSAAMLRAMEAAGIARLALWRYRRFTPRLGVPATARACAEVPAIRVLRDVVGAAPRHMAVSMPKHVAAAILSARLRAVLSSYAIIAHAADR